MVRPKKPRYFDAIQLAEYLYPDPKSREGYWRYARPDVSFKTFRASNVEQANKIALVNNKNRDNAPVIKKATRGQLSNYIPEFITWRESTSPKLCQKDSWLNRKYSLNKFGKEMTIPIASLRYQQLSDWWDTQSHHQQKSRHREFRRLFNYLMGRNLLPHIQHNPFTLSDDKAKFEVRAITDRQSERLTIQGFWAIYDAADTIGYTCLQIAMGISLTAFMRIGDLCSLKLSTDLEGDLLKKVIGKSLNQKGSTNAARRSWDGNQYALLKQLIQRAREEAFSNHVCPYVISHLPKQRRIGKSKDHFCQVTKRRLNTMFIEAREKVGFTMENPPVFHCIRSLATALATNAGYDLSAISHANAHSSEGVTKIYQEGHELPFEDVEVRFTAELLGRDFSK